MKKLTPALLRKAADNFLWDGCGDLGPTGASSEYSCYALRNAMNNSPFRTISSWPHVLEYAALLVKVGALRKSNMMGSIQFRTRDTPKGGDARVVHQEIRFMLMHFLALYLEDEAKRATKLNHVKEKSHARQ